MPRDLLCWADKILTHLKRDSEWLQQQLGQYAPISRDFVTKIAYETIAYSDSFGKVNGQYPSFYIGESFMGFRSCPRPGRSSQVLQVGNRLPYKQIISIWLKLPLVKMRDTGKCPGVRVEEALNVIDGRHNRVKKGTEPILM